MAEDEEKKSSEKEDTPEKTGSSKPATKKKAPVKKKTLKPKATPVKKDGTKETEKPKPRPPAKKKKVVEKEEVEKKKAPKEEESKPHPPAKKKKVVVEEEPEEDETEETEEPEEEEEEKIEIIEEVETYKVKIKPELNAELKHKLVIRKGIKNKTPTFSRQEWFRYKKLGTAWRKPRGLHSKARKHKGYRTNVVSVGYGSPADARNLHPSGFEEVMVYNTADLEKIDPKLQAARIGHGVGTRKRVAIEKEAEEKGIRVLNPRR